MTEPEELLPGGNLTPVVRVGSTVRRMQRSWSPAVHVLLRHLENVGFASAPRFLGIDEHGREVLSYLPGQAGFFPDVWREESLVVAAHLLRDYHEATLTFRSPPRSSSC